MLAVSSLNVLRAGEMLCQQNTVTHARGCAGHFPAQIIFYFSDSELGRTLPGSCPSSCGSCSRTCKQSIPFDSLPKFDAKTLNYAQPQAHMQEHARSFNARRACRLANEPWIMCFESKRHKRLPDESCNSYACIFLLAGNRRQTQMGRDLQSHRLI